jgi:hypothetical protein
MAEHSAERTQLRAQLRAAHPDHGGDPAEFAAALRAYRGLPPVGSDPSAHEVVFVAAPRGIRMVVAPVRRVVHRRLVRLGLLPGRVD